MASSGSLKKLWRSLALWGLASAVFFGVQWLWPDVLHLPSGSTLAAMLAMLAAIMAGASLASLLTHYRFRHQLKPDVEGQMVGRLYRLVAVIAALMVIAYGMGQLSAFGQFFSLFGGMILGWSLQAPVSGFAAWALVSLKRPIRPGDRVQFPSLGLTGDVQEIGLMYTVLNQVGGSISSEEAVGRFILLPNAMLFSQVAINYTVKQEAAYLLDEVVVRMTYDSDWDAAEKVLLQAARDVTADVIAATGEQPYIRSDTYDYGVYLRLRYRTKVATRAETSYEINKRIYLAIKDHKSVDLAIPFVYSYRSGVDRREDAGPSEQRGVQQLSVDSILPSERTLDPTDVASLARSIATDGLLQPIIVAESGQEGLYDVVAGHLRYAACLQLGWRMVPAVIRPRQPLRKVSDHDQS